MTALDLCLPPDFACGFRLPQCQLYEFKKKTVNCNRNKNPLISFVN